MIMRGGGGGGGEGIDSILLYWLHYFVHGGAHGNNVSDKTENLKGGA